MAETKEQCGRAPNRTVSSSPGTEQSGSLDPIPSGSYRAICDIQRIDEQGIVWVGQGWMRPDGNYDELEIGLSSDDIEYFDEA